MATHSSVFAWRIPGMGAAIYGVTQSWTRLKQLSSSSKEQVVLSIFNFKVTVTIHSDFGVQEKKICHCFHITPSLYHKGMRSWCWERLKAGGEADNRGWDRWMASPTQWTWVWASSRKWWWTGKSGMLQSLGLQRVRHDWAMELNWWDWMPWSLFFECWVSS